MARQVTARHMLASSTGYIYYGKRGANGQFVKAGNAIDYFKEALPLYDAEVAIAIARNLNSMSAAFLKSYTEGGGNNDTIPQWSGNMADSTSILVYLGRELKGCHTQNPFLTSEKQRWFVSPSLAGSGKGQEFVKRKKDNYDNVRSVQSRLASPEYGEVNVTAVLYVAIPYAEITNELGTPDRHDSKVKWFTSMAGDFAENCIRAAGRSEGVEFKGDVGALVAQAVSRI